MEHPDRWTCDVDAQQCTQTVKLVDNEVRYNASFLTERDCYEHYSTLTTSPCKRWGCLPTTPFACVAFASNTTDKLYGASDCSNACVPSYTCDNGECKSVLPDAPQKGPYNSLPDCQKSCRKYQCVYDDISHKASCQKTHDYGDPGYTNDACQAECSKTRWQCEKGAEQCSQNVMYGDANYDVAYVTQDACKGECKRLSRANCVEGVCEEAASGTYTNMFECYNDCGKYGCDEDSGTCKFKTRAEGGIYQNAASCNLECGQKYSCVLGSCVPASDGKYKSYKTCRADCDTSNSYVCDHLHGQCIKQPNGVPYEECVGTSGDKCQMYTYTCNKNVYPPMCELAPTGTVGSEAYDCLRECGYVNPRDDLYLNVPQGVLFRYDAQSKSYESLVLGRPVAVFSDVVALQDLASTASEMGAPIFNYTYYSTDPQFQGVIKGYRSFRNQSTMDTFTDVSSYRNSIMNATQVYGGGAFAGFASNTQISTETGQTITRTSSLMASKLTIEVIDGDMYVDLGQAEQYSALNDSFLTDVLSVSRVAFRNGQDHEDFAGAQKQTEFLVRKYGSHLVVGMTLGKRFIQTT